MKYILILTLFFTSSVYSQTDSTKSATHIFWSEDQKILMADFRDTISSPKYNMLCDTIGLCWGACTSLFSVLDEPIKRRKRGKLLEKVYFAPAFNRNDSYHLNADSLDYLTQLLIFDLFELNARKCRRDLRDLCNMMPYYGTVSIQFKTVLNDNKKLIEKFIGSLTQDCYINKKENAYNEWRKTIDEMLAETIEYKTTNEDRYRFISKKPLNKDYQKAKK